MTETEYKEVRLGPDKLQIPSDWEIEQIEPMISVLTGDSFSSEEFNEEGKGLPLVRIRNLQDGETDTYFSGEYKEKYLIEPEDLLIGMDGEFHTVRWNGGEALLNQRVAKVETDEEINQDFLFYKLIGEIREIQARTPATTVKHLSKSDINEIRIPLPPLAEQRRIAEILSTVDEAIQQTDEIIETSKELKKGLMQDLLTKGIGHNEFKEVQLGPKTVKIPEEWSKYKLEEISNIITRGKQPNYVEESEIEVVNQSCIYWDGFHRENVKYLDEETAEEWKEKYFLHENDVLINSTGKGTLGRVMHWEKDTDKFVIDSHVTRVDLKKDLADAGYLRYYLESSQGQEAIFTFCVSGSTGQIELSKGDLTTVPLIVPPLDEQREIAEKLSTVDEKIRQEEEYRENLEELKKGLMQDLLTGEVRVNVEGCGD